MRRPTPTALLGGALSLLMLAPLSAAPAVADPDAAPGVVVGGAPAEQVPADEVLAEEALAEVEEVFADGGAAPPAGEPDATVALSELRGARDDLSARDRATADDYLARPTGSSADFYGVRYGTDEAPPTCGTDVCVHRVDSTDDAATPRYARRVLDTVQDLHGTYVAAGYRAPLPDRAARDDGGNAKTDIYLADIGDRGIYGYCTSDDSSGSTSTWAYCVLDNDYKPTQYALKTPRENLQVTAAHEYFHAVQFAYDSFEDPWFMEGTATWVEDEVFDDVDDNVSYLRRSPLSSPGRSLDLDRGLAVYGSWSFFRFLTERFPEDQAGLPTLVRDAWERAAQPGNGSYSTKALEGALAARGSTVRAQFGDFVAANRFPAQRYEEGAANSYPVAPVADQRVLTRKDRRHSAAQRLAHLAGATVRLEPGAGLRGSKWVLKVRADLPSRRRGAELRVSVVAPDGTATTRSVRLPKDGEVALRRPFSSQAVQAVEVHLVNASTRFRFCGGSGAVSCQGFARDDGLRATLTASVRAR